ncbi:MAG: VOC family protein [Chromatiales bacterium]|nr:VOC family protein [Chromatiales bacterium]
MDDRMKNHGHIGWCDLMSDDVDKARDFYTGVLGWDTEVMDIGRGPYTVFKADDRPVAGLMGKPPEGPASFAPTAWTSYVTVDDVDARTARVAAAGGSVLAGPMDIPTVGRMSIIQDPTGGVIGIITYADPEA